MPTVQPARESYRRASRRQPESELRQPSREQTETFASPLFFVGPKPLFGDRLHEHDGSSSRSLQEARGMCGGAARFPTQAMVLATFHLASFPNEPSHVKFVLVSPPSGISLLPPFSQSPNPFHVNDDTPQNRLRTSFHPEQYVRNAMRLGIRGILYRIPAFLVQFSLSCSHHAYSISKDDHKRLCVRAFSSFPFAPRHPISGLATQRVWAKHFFLVIALGVPQSSLPFSSAPASIRRLLNGTEFQTAVSLQYRTVERGILTPTDSRVIQRKRGWQTRTLYMDLAPVFSSEGSFQHPTEDTGRRAALHEHSSAPPGRRIGSVARTKTKTTTSISVRGMNVTAVCRSMFEFELAQSIFTRLWLSPAGYGSWHTSTECIHKPAQYTFLLGYEKFLQLLGRSSHSPSSQFDDPKFQKIFEHVTGHRTDFRICEKKVTKLGKMPRKIQFSRSRRDWLRDIDLASQDNRPSPESGETGKIDLDKHFSRDLWWFFESRAAGVTVGPANFRKPKFENLGHRNEKVRGTGGAGGPGYANGVGGAGGDGMGASLNWDIQGDVIMNGSHHHHGDRGIHILHRAAALGAMYDSAESFPQPKCHPETRTKMLKDQVDADQEAKNYCPLSVSPCRSWQIRTHANSCRPAPGCRQTRWLLFLQARRCYARQWKNGVRDDRIPARAQRSLRTPISHVVENNPSIVALSIERQMQNLISEPCHPYGDCEPLAIIIDGLDECAGHHVQQTILRAIHSATYYTIPNLTSARCSTPLSIPVTVARLMWRNCLMMSAHISLTSLREFITILCAIANFRVHPKRIDQLFQLPEGETRLLLRGLHSLLDVPSDDSEISVIRDRISPHYASFFDFLNNPGRSRTFCVGTLQHRIDLARIVLEAYVGMKTLMIFGHEVAELLPLIGTMDPKCVFGVSAIDIPRRMLAWLKKIPSASRDLIKLWEDYECMRPSVLAARLAFRDVALQCIRKVVKNQLDMGGQVDFWEQYVLGDAISYLVRFSPPCPVLYRALWCIPMGLIMEYFWSSGTLLIYHVSKWLKSFPDPPMELIDFWKQTQVKLGLKLLDVEELKYAEYAWRDMVNHWNQTIARLRLPDDLKFPLPI
ncbi:hypothetical protein C8R45DRAFT_1165368 [Mycena sanguinolenta]|nr:hypothetical protein C8R45DRAFT_1165368 [Mycena sanguinolenta]